MEGSVGRGDLGARKGFDLQAYIDYSAGMKEKQPIQYTIRRVSERMDQLLREEAATYGQSLNEATLDVLRRGLSMEGEPPVHHDLDQFIGSWVSDPECEAVLAEMDQIDEGMWS